MVRFLFSLDLSYIYMSRYEIILLLDKNHCDASILFKYAEVRGLVNKKHVQDGHEQVQQALLDYTLTCYPSIPVCLSHIYVHRFSFF